MVSRFAKRLASLIIATAGGMQVMGEPMAWCQDSTAQVDAAARDPVQAAAAQAFDSRKENAVRLSVTRKIRDRDRTFEVQALVMDSQGLVVAALSSVEAQLGAARGRMPPGSSGASDAGELTRVAMICSDGSEAEGKVVLTDPDLDLAFIRITLTADNSAVTLPAAPPAAAKPELLDEVLGISRMDAGFQYEATASLSQIAAVLEIPRVLYVPASSLGGQGVGAFNLQGECLGITTLIRGRQLIVPIETISRLAATIPE